MGRAKPDLNDPTLSIDERNALQALYQPSLLADELLKSQKNYYYQQQQQYHMNNTATLDPSDAPSSEVESEGGKEEKAMIASDAGYKM